MSIVTRVGNPGGCLMSVKWDFADDELSGKWTRPVEVYRHRVVPTSFVATSTFDTGNALAISKNRIRGQGRALKIRFAAEENKDMVLVGWALTNEGNAAE